MRRVTCRTALQFERSMLVDERPCLIRVAPDATCVGTNGKLSLFRLKASVRIMTIAALHRSLKNLVMERFAELRFGLVVTRNAKLRLICGEHLYRCLTGILCRDIGGERHRTGTTVTGRRPVGRMTFIAADVVTPVLAAAKVVVVLFACVTGQTSFGCRLSIQPLERDYLRDIAGTFHVRLARAVTGFATDDLAFP